LILWYNQDDTKELKMKDIVNDRVNEAQAELKKREDKLNKLIQSAKGKKVSAEFTEGAKILADMIKGQTEIIDKVVFETPKTMLEQRRNLQLATGDMNQTPKEFMKNSTDLMDMMLDTLEGMVH